MFDIPQHFTNEIIRQFQQTRVKLDRIIELLELLTRDTEHRVQADGAKMCSDCGTSPVMPGTEFCEECGL